MYFIVSHLDSARNASKQYDKTNFKNVCLLSPVGAGAALGASYWHAMLKNLKEETGAYFRNILHCGESIGAVQLAYSLKLPAVIYTGEADVSYLENVTFRIYMVEAIYKRYYDAARNLDEYKK